MNYPRHHLSQAIDIPHAIYTAVARRFHPGSPLRQDWQSIFMTISTYYVLAQCFDTLIFLTTRVIVHVPTATQTHAFLKVPWHFCMISCCFGYCFEKWYLFLVYTLSVAFRNIVLLTDNDTYTGVMSLSCRCIRKTKKSIDAPAGMHMSRVVDWTGRVL